MVYTPYVIHCSWAKWLESSYILIVGGAAVIKAQVLAGGRGKGHFDSGLQGGVKLAKRYNHY